MCRRFTRKRGVEISERTVGHLLNRYDEVLAVSLTDSRRLRGTAGTGHPGGGRVATGCRTRGAVGGAGVCERGDYAGAVNAVGSDRGLCWRRCGLGYRRR